MNAYQQLEARKKRTSALGNAVGILQWDQQTMMPEGAAPGTRVGIGGTQRVDARNGNGQGIV